MSSYNTKIYMPQDNDSIVVEDGGEIDLGANVVLAVTGTNVILTGLPTVDPHVVGALWKNANVLTVSAG
jgi:hypothetical protein